MNWFARMFAFSALAAALGTGCQAPARPDPVPGRSSELNRFRCEALRATADLTVYEALWRPTADSVPAHCYIKGSIPPGIHYYVQLPASESWNRRFLNLGDGGHDGDLDYAPHRLAQGYVVANSNMGHDSGVERGASFAFNNRQAEVDYGYRHIPLTVQAAKTAIEAYYGEPPAYSYHEGCSTGGRQGLMAAQRFPMLFDGIVAGAPANFLQRINVAHNWDMQHMFRNGFEGALAFDTDGDGTLDSLTKADMLREAVLARCDAGDGVQDGIVSDPLSCDFDPAEHLAGAMCPSGANAADCFTPAQLNAIQAVYDGPSDSNGVPIFKGKALGSEVRWPLMVIPHEGNRYFPLQMLLARDYVNYLFYEDDPGVPTARPTDLSLEPDRTLNPPEFAWWQFDFDDFTAGLGDVMRHITDADEPDLTRFLIHQGGKLIIYHGWVDSIIPPEPTVDYFNDMIGATFDGNSTAAQQSARLFMAPGMGHCRGGPGPDTWDKLAPLVDWVEKGLAPESIVVTHSSGGRIDDERILCPYPRQAVYVGPGDPNDRANWVDSNFVCEGP